MDPHADATLDLPVTVSFTHGADPGHATEMAAWIRAGLTMAEGIGRVAPARPPRSGWCSSRATCWPR